MRIKTFLALIMLGALPTLACASNPYYNSEKPHHTPEGFQNIYSKRDKKFGDFWKWRWEKWNKEVKGPEKYSFPLLKPDLKEIHSPPSSTRVTWVGHATLLVQINGLNILTDPHFTRRASPVSWAGPKRAVSPAIKIKDLPPVDIVVISHNHYDSLDVGTIKKLKNSEAGKETTYFVPLGLKPWFKELGVSRVIEMDWWQKHNFKGSTVVAVPVQHWSKRTLWDTNETLWAGWVIEHKDFRFFFAGDSGYCLHFKEIGEKYGPFDLAAIPIGAYEPRWFMKNAHMNPKESVQVHRDVKSKKSVAIHWGTFVLTDEPLTEPPKKLKKAKQLFGVPKNEFLVLKHGETLNL